MQPCYAPALHRDIWRLEDPTLARERGAGHGREAKVSLVICTFGTWGLSRTPSQVERASRLPSGAVSSVAMAANARFYLLFTDQPTGFDLMGECKLCGAMTEQPLALAWEMRHVACSNCGVVDATRCRRPGQVERASGRRAVRHRPAAGAVSNAPFQ